ncbi:MAG: hypothetical protein KTR16_13360 [Acidiferrobacterales bacterium]|nr:hypothetical protein [Acidiferrobacterales bacterium]
MSQSNNIESLEDILFGHRLEEAHSLDDQVFPYANNMVTMQLYTDKCPTNGALMSVEEFLDLIPANGFFH